MHRSRPTLAILACLAATLLLTLWFAFRRDEDEPRRILPAGESLTTPDGMESDSPPGPSARARIDPGTAPVSSRRGSVRIRAFFVAGNAREPAADMDLVLKSGRSSATVIADRKVRTDASGHVTVQDLPAGHVWVLPLRGLTGKSRVNVVPGVETEAELGIRQAVTIAGTVVDPYGAPVPHAVIEFHGMRMSRPRLPVGRARRDGTFTIRGVSGVGLVSARSLHCHPTDATLVPSDPQERTRMRLVLRRGGVSIRGEVVDRNGAPVPGARVRIGETVRVHAAIGSRDGQALHPLAPVEVSTTADGRFQLDGLPPGVVRVFVKAPPFAPWSERIHLPAEPRIVLDAGACCEGRALLAGGEPATGTIVIVGEDLPWHERFDVLVAADGSFRVAGLPVGTLSITAESLARQRIDRTVTTHAERTSRVDFVFGGTIRLRGRVVTDRGRGLADLGLVAFGGPDTEPWEASTQTGAAGAFVFESLPRGDRATVLVVRGTPTRAGEAKVVLGESGPEGLVITVPDPGRRSGSVAGRVLDARGRPVPGATASLYHRHRFFAAARVQPSGRFELDDLYPGSFRIEATATGFEPMVREVRVIEDETVQLGDLSLQRLGWITVELPSAAQTGAPAIAVRDASFCVVSGVEPKGGVRRSSDLAPGQYVLQVGGTRFAAESIPVVVRPGRSTRVTVRPRRGIHVSLRVVLPEGGRDGESVRLCLRRSGRVVLHREMPRAPGRIRPLRCCLAEGEYEATATWGGAETRARFVVGARGSAPVSLAFD